MFAQNVATVLFGFHRTETTVPEVQPCGENAGNLFAGCQLRGVSRDVLVVFSRLTWACSLKGNHHVFLYTSLKKKMKGRTTQKWVKRLKKQKQVIFHAAGAFICPLAEGQPFPKKIYF
ncbi:uncharacterized protein LOC141896499 [Acropora palmata]|uniref:uncharacterized protein LOC141896499 n=1 Tax=Acropora palmata TaxID=6131 RepID=UPI003DA04D73